jgi:hypothetical protein
MSEHLRNTGHHLVQSIVKLAERLLGTASPLDTIKRKVMWILLMESSSVMPHKPPWIITNNGVPPEKGK